MKQLNYFLLNGSLAVSLYIGLVMGYKPFENIAIFGVWFFAITRFSLLPDRAIEELKGKSRSVPPWFNWAVNSAFVLVLAGYEYTITASFYLLSCFVAEGVWQRANEGVNNEQ